MFSTGGNHMTREAKWHFPDNQGGHMQGLGGPSTATFEQDPMKGLAREMCQNSIDAQLHRHESLQVRLEFNLFTIPTKSMPGYASLKQDIETCYQMIKEDAYSKDRDTYERMLAVLNAKHMHCLRISDFHTTGLLGVREYSHKSPFAALTKGIGISNKADGSGGSRGIGKFAAVLNSAIATIFYSTYNSDGERGYTGIAYTGSHKIDDTLYTQGIGYFSDDDSLMPIFEEASLDASFSRKEKEFGTDVYIMGFEPPKQWEELLVAHILDNFMSAFCLTDFEVVINGLVLNKKTIHSYVKESDKFLSVLGAEYEKMKQSICAQYDLLTDENANIKELAIGRLGKVTMYVKGYNREHRQEAINTCLLIRYPYMKIKGYAPKTIKFHHYSAMCVLSHDELSERLRKCENPEHDNWVFKGTDEDDDKVRLGKNALGQLQKYVREYIAQVLTSEIGDQANLNAANDILPDIDDAAFGDESFGKKGIQIGELMELGVRSRGPKRGEQGAPLLDGNRKVKRARTRKVDQQEKSRKKLTHRHALGESTEDTTKGKLSSIYYKHIMNRRENCYDIIFTSPYTEENCELLVEQLGSGSDKYPIRMESATINGEAGTVEKNRLVGFSLEEGKVYKISYRTKEKGKFAAEVTLYAIRK